MSERITPFFAQYALHTVNHMRKIPRVSRTALEMIAADRHEYRVEHQHIENGVWHPVTKWSPEWPLHEGRTVAPDERIVCRRVSPEWVVTDE